MLREGHSGCRRCATAPAPMPPVFLPRSNLIARASLFATFGLVATAIAFAFLLSGSAWDRGVPLTPWQPVPFSHAHHAGELGIDCRYCHTSVDSAAAAGMPSTDVCANCHWQIWTDAGMLEPIRASWRTGVRLRWNRVHETPDYVYFEHAVHVRAGVQCAHCHGQVERMPLLYQAVDHTMQWCIDCHRDPFPHLPAQASGDQIDLAGLTSCSTCHR